MSRIFKAIVFVFGTCIGLGFIVSVIEKHRGKNGWGEGHIPYGPYEKHIKRPLNFGLSLFALILLLLLLLVIAIVVRIKLGSPVIFTQERPGLGGEVF